MPSVSGRELAKALGVSEGAVRKLKGTRLAGAMSADGRFDLDRAKALYAANVDPAMQRDKPSRAAPAAAAGADAVDAGPGLPTTGGPDQNKARAILTTEKAIRERIKRKKDEGNSIDRGPASTLVQTLARTLRDGILGFTDKHYAEIASELGIEDVFRVYQVLDKYQRRYVEKTLEAIKVDVLG